MSDENLYSAPDAEVSVSQSDELAGRGVRLVAVLIDSLIIVGLSIAFLAMTNTWEQMAREPTVMSAIQNLLIGIVVFLLLNGYLLATRGQTIGKSLLSIKIVNVENGSLLPPVKLIGLRYLPVWIVSSIPLLGPLLGLVNALFIFRSDRRCIHDLIAGTHVVKT